MSFSAAACPGRLLGAIRMTHDAPAGASSGPARIARSFAHDLALVPGAELAAVGSRSRARAAGVRARSTAVAAAYGSYEELVADPDVDVVYIASPHALHLEHARLAFEAGKHVLCEKPLTLSRRRRRGDGRAGAEHDRFLMEAMWTACHPVILEVRERLRAGEFGTPRHLHAELGFVVDAAPRRPDARPGARRRRAARHGHLPADLRAPDARRGRGADRDRGTLRRRGIDLDIAIAGRYPGGALATMTASMTSWSSRRAEIATDRGRLTLEDFHHPATATFTPFATGGGDGVSEPAGRSRIDAARARDRPRLRQRDRRGRAAAWPRGCGRARWSRTRRR